MEQRHNCWCVCVWGRPSSQIPIATSGIRAMGYLMRHQLRAEGSSAVPQRIITHFVKVRLASYHDMLLSAILLSLASSHLQAT